MDPDFSSVPLRVRKLFSEPYLYDLPPFQRPFSWTAREAGQLLDDLLAAVDEQAPTPMAQRPAYFLGSIVLMPRGAGADDAPARVYDIIDGQQRLVTLSILIACLRDLGVEAAAPGGPPLHSLVACAGCPGVPADHPYRVRLRAADAAFFAEHVLDRGTCDLMPDIDVDDLAEAQRNIIRCREHLLDELHDLSPERRRELAAYLLERCYVVVITAADIDSGYRMFTVLNTRGKELTRNDILKAELIGAMPVDRQPHYNMHWDAEKERLGDRFEALFSHIRSIHGRPKAPVVAEIKTIAARTGVPTFLDGVFRPMAATYAQILGKEHPESPHSADIRRHLTYLSWLRSEDWIPVAMTWMSGNAGKPDRVAAFLAELDRFAYGLALLGVGSDKRIGRYRMVAAAIADGSVLDPDKTPLSLSREEQRTIIYNASRDLYDRSQQLCKLVLLRLNDELAGAVTGIEPGSVTIEHVLPQRLGRNSPWRQLFTDAEVREYCTHCLGNLVLISTDQNARAGNAEFAEKRQVYFSEGFDRRLALTDMLRDIHAWRPQQVGERDELLLTRLKAMWRLDGPSGPRTAAPAGEGRRKRRYRNRTKTEE